MTEKTNILDKVISWFDPVSGIKRLAARETISMAGGYKSGDRGRRALKNWKRKAGSADAEILPALQNMRADSRDLMRNAPLARGAVNTVVTNVVGTGLRPQARPDREVLKQFAKLTDDQIDAFERAAEREWKIWSQSTACDAGRTMTFSAMQALVLRSTLESGDIFTLRRMIKRPGVRHELALQMLEADRVDNPPGVSDTATLCGGVKRDQYGAPVAYHILKTHPGNIYSNGQKYETQEYPAFMPNGEWNVLHLMIKERPEQTRGVPYLAPVVELLKQLSEYTDAEIMAAVISSMFTVFVKSEGAGGALPGSTDGSSVLDDEIKMGSGQIIDLAPGEDITFADPNRPNQAFDAFVQSVLRQIGVALELPFEVLIKHFTASYSAAQAALLEAWKFFRMRRHWLTESFAAPVWNALISECVAKGYIAAPGFFGNDLVKSAYLGVEFIGPPRGSIDPMKEASANEVYEDRGWKTAQAITAELTGGDWDSNHSRRLKEAEMRKELPPPQQPQPAAPATDDTGTDAEKPEDETNEEKKDERD